MGKPDPSERDDRKPVIHCVEKEKPKSRMIEIKALNHEREIKFINIFLSQECRKYLMRRRILIDRQILIKIPQVTPFDVDISPLSLLIFNSYSLYCN